jgi:cytoskeletal protein CcmA (bactofilin family)
MSAANNDFGTIIGKDATFKGELSYEGAAQVLGKVEGIITAKGKLSVAEGARCQADIKAGEVAVQGHVEGNVEAADRIDLQSSGVLHGDIVAARMSMADGASFVGTCRIGTNANGAVRPATPPAQKSEQKPAEVVVKDQKATATKK